MSDEQLAGNTNEITDVMGNKYEIDCVGCATAGGKVALPGGVIYDDDSFMLYGDPEVPLKGFLILNTKRHVNSLTELSSDEQHKMVDIISKAITVIKELGIATEVTLVQEERSKHFHAWIFPNQPRMTEKFGKGITHLREISAYAKENATDEQRQDVIATIEMIRERFGSNI